LKRELIYQELTAIFCTHTYISNSPKNQLRAPQTRHSHAKSCSEGVLSRLVNDVGLHVLGLVLIEFHKLGQVKLGLLEDLDLADEDVLKGEDLGAVLGDLLGDLIAQELSEELLEGVLGDLSHEDFHHLGAELVHVGALGVASGLDLVLVASGEGNSESSDKVAIGGLGLHESLND